MGEEIYHTRYKKHDFQEFSRRLACETRWLEDSLDDHECDGSFQCGFEIEGWLVDENNTPAPVNEEFITTLADSSVVPELAKFNFEINTSVNELRGNVFHQCQTELDKRWQACHLAASELNKKCIIIGTLPSCDQSMFNAANMSERERYHSLNEQLIRLREGAPAHIEIEADETVCIDRQDVMLESAATSFQVHLQCPASLSSRVYNAATVLSAITVGINANAPYLLGKKSWSESRIPLFEQAVAVDPPKQHHHPKRVTFGQGYISSSMFELFAENLQRFEILLPELFDDDTSALRHLCLHNGTIWRWNRPLVSISNDGRPQLRLEHRVISAGPTNTDMLATAAFFYGATIALAIRETAPEHELTFAQAKSNFYLAAKHGATATIEWFNNEKHSIATLVLTELLPLAESGLHYLGISQRDTAYYLGIIEQRMESQQTGAQWQRNFVAKHGANMSALTQAYYEHQNAGSPVHTWTL